MTENVEMSGAVTLRLIDRDGNVVMERHVKNLIVKSGRLLVAQLFGGVTGGTPPSRITHMAVGADGTAAADDQKTLLAERSPRKPVDVSYSDVTQMIQSGAGFIAVPRVRASVKSVFDYAEANGTAPLREAAIFTAAAAGVMYNRVVFPDVTKTNAFQLTLLWDITF